MYRYLYIPYTSIWTVITKFLLLVFRASFHETVMIFKFTDIPLKRVLITIHTFQWDVGELVLITQFRKLIPRWLAVDDETQR